MEIGGAARLLVQYCTIWRIAVVRVFHNVDGIHAWATQKKTGMGRGRAGQLEIIRTGIETIRIQLNSSLVPIRNYEDPHH